MRPLRELLRHPVACVALFYLVALILACVFASLIAPYKPEYEDLSSVLAGPSGRHLLGTDNLGRDVLSRLLFGGRVTLLDAAEAVATFTIVGVPVGLVAGFLGGRVERLIMFITDIVLSLPVIIILLVVAAVFTGDVPLMITLGVVASPSLIRVVRASTAAVKNELYVKAAEVVGLSRGQVLRRHVFPQVLAPILVQVSVFAAAAIVIEAALGYLGLDVSPPAPSWGSMVADAATVISQQSWLIVPSGCIIGLTVLALGLVGDALRDAHAGRRLLATTARSRHVPAPAVASEDAVGASGDDLRIDVVENLLLRVRGLSVAVSTPSGELPVVDRVSFDLSRGESLGIVGESGSGKTLTALALLGLLPTAARVTGGSVRLGGRELVGQANSKEHARMRGSEIGFISQEPMVALDPVFTVGSVLREAVRVHHAGSRKDASNEVLELLGRVRLPSPRAVAARYPHELSGGMAQRVAIALALAGRPKLLIADEPTTALDVTVQAEILDLLRALRDDTGMSILLVTHDWGVIADFCERTAVMYAGQVVELADVADVFGRPQHPYTEGLLAANPHLAGHGPLRSIGGTVPLPGEWGVGCRFASRCPYVTEDCVESPVPVSLSGHGQLTRCLHPERVGGGSGVAVR